MLQSATEHELTSVTEVRLDVGKLAGVSLESLRFAWGFLSANEPLTTGAELIINEPAGQGLCRGCGFSGPVTDFIRICPHCGTGGLRFTSGEEFMVTGISGE